MTWLQSFRLHSLEYHPDGQALQLIHGITTASIAGNPEIEKTVTAGSPYADVASLNTIRPVLSFTTTNLEDALGALGPGVDGACITSAVNPGVNLYFARYDCGVVDQVATNHILYNIGQGAIVPTTLTVDHRGDASMTYELSSTYDGVQQPVVKSEVAFAGLPVLGAGTDKRFTMDRMEIGSAHVEGKRNITVNFNATVTAEGADSDLFDSVQSVDSLLQQISITGVEPGWLAPASGLVLPVAPVLGDITSTTVQEADPTRFYLKDRNQAIGVAAHILIEFNGLVTWDTVVQGDATSVAGSVLNVDLTNDSGNPPITITTGVVIPP